MPVINAIQRDLTFNHHNHEHGSTIDLFHNVLVQSDRMEMTSVVVKLFPYFGSISSSNFYLKDFKNPNFGKFRRTAP